jgi:hypothetical protein
MALDWQVESLRASLFSARDIPISDEDWRAIYGQSDNYSRQSMQGGYIYSAKFGDSQLSLSNINRRVDIIQSASPPVEPTNVAFPSVGAWDAVRDRFATMAKAWIVRKEISVARIAFGVILLAPMDSKIHAYDTLKALLSSVKVDSENMRDLLYRINWPSTSGVVDTLLLNRITSWSALEFYLARVELGAVPSTIAQDRGYALRLEIDNNTDSAQSEPFDNRKVIPILQELISLASESVVNGEHQ